MMFTGSPSVKKVLSELRKQEDEMFDRQGHGFDRYSIEYLRELEYKKLLKKFEYEKKHDLPPSYDPSKHGTLVE